MKVSDASNYLLSQKVDCSVFGDSKIIISGYCSLSNPRKKCLTWVKTPSSADLSPILKVGPMAVVTPERLPQLPSDYAQIVTANPKRAFFSLLDEFFAKESLQQGIHPTAIVLAENIGEGVTIGAHSYIAANVTIGHGTRIGENVSIVCPCTIGADCIVWPGVVIGSDGFGYWSDDKGESHKVPHYGGVYIGNRVEIGANSCIDRGTLDDTVIGDGSKIDNLVHVAHNCQIGRGSLIIAQSGISGSVKLGDHAYIAPHSVVSNQKRLGNDSFIGLGSVVIRDVDDGVRVFGNPAKPMRV